MVSGTALSMAVRCGDRRLQGSAVDEGEPVVVDCVVDQAVGDRGGLQADVFVDAAFPNRATDRYCRDVSWRGR
jgi:hypothetical protein